jgi:hypothetical protein
MPEIPPDVPVFSFIGGRPVNPGTISLVFHSLVPQLNIATPAGGTPPHVHDLRHNSGSRIIPSAVAIAAYFRTIIKVSISASR